MGDIEKNEYRIEKLEEEVKQLKTDIKPIVELEFGFRELKESVDKLTMQFQQFTNQSNSRAYEWLKYLGTALISCAITYFFKK